MTQDPVPPELPPDQASHPPDPFGPTIDPLVQGDPMLDALERSIENQPGGSKVLRPPYADLDPTGRMLDRVEESIVCPPNSPASTNPAQMEIPIPPDTPVLGEETPAFQTPPPLPVSSPPTSPPFSEVPPIDRQPPPRPLPGMKRRSGGGPRRRSARSMERLLGTGLLGGNRKKHIGSLPPGMEYCPNQGFEPVDRRHCESCPEFQASPQNQARECHFWWRIRQQEPPTTESEDSEADRDE